MVCEQSQFLFIELTVSADHMRLLRVLEGLNGLTVLP